MAALRTFQHCSKGVNLVCFSVPRTCPLCRKDTALTESRIPPYVLPSPFVSSEDAPWSIVLKPTEGDFIRFYDPSCNLHIGVTDEKGLVTDFDEKGLNSNSSWPQCQVVLSAGPPHRLQWTQTLTDLARQTKWQKDRYHEIHWNCFDFVLQFLERCDLPASDEIGYMPKGDFCNVYLREKARLAEKYVHLYRQVLSQGCVVLATKAS